jgi:MoxR-like ATPase
MARQTNAAPEAITVTPADAAEVLYRMLPARRPVLLVGQPGVGKSAIVAQAVNRFNLPGIVQTVLEKLGLVKARLVTLYPALSDPTDFKGLPAMVDGRACFVPYNDLAELLSAAPDCLTVCFLDEIGQAPQSVQAALMSLVHARTVGLAKLPDGVVFVGATNRQDDGAGVGAFLTPLLDRWHTVLHVSPDLESWQKWATVAGIRPDVSGFVQLRPDILTAWKPTRDFERLPTPRSLHQLSETLDAIGADCPPRLEMPTVAGVIGRGWAAEFVSFRRLVEQMPDPDLAIANPKTATLPKIEGDGMSVFYAFCIAVAYRASAKTIAAIDTLSTRPDWPAELRCLLWEIMLRRDSSLERTKEFTRFAVTNHSVYV